ncbi:selenide, water dikinase [Clostridium tetanomorphum]|nr:selenide, water dikinase [Clostridium tetanomorphum]
MNIVCFPSCLPVEILGEILRGGADKVIEAGAVVVGGHSVEDNEPKYGLSVTGEVNPKKVLRNYGCNVGDILILTKPLGIGIINTAIKGGLASEESYKKAVKIMTTLNKYAADIINKYDVTACTDITGFGLMGHSYEMASASKVSFKIYKELIPYIEESREYAEMGIVPEGAYRNKEYLKGKYSLMNVLEWMEDILFDPQTSGGLLFSISKELGENIIEELGKLEIESSIIGEVIPLEENILIVE